MYATHFYISYSFLNIPLISRYATHFSISVYHIIVSYTTLTQHLTGNLAGNLAGDLLLWVYFAGDLAPDLPTELFREPHRGSRARPCNGTLQGSGQ